MTYFGSVELVKKSREIRSETDVVVIINTSTANVKIEFISKTLLENPEMDKNASLILLLGDDVSVLIDPNNLEGNNLVFFGEKKYFIFILAYETTDFSYSPGTDITNYIAERGDRPRISIFFDMFF